MERIAHAARDRLVNQRGGDAVGGVHLDENQIIDALGDETEDTAARAVVGELVLKAVGLFVAPALLPMLGR